MVTVFKSLVCICSHTSCGQKGSGQAQTSFDCHQTFPFNNPQNLFCGGAIKLFLKISMVNLCFA